MYQAVEKCPCRDDNSPGSIRDADMIFHTHNPAIFDNDAVDKSLPEMEVFFLLHNGFHGETIELFVTLKPGGLNCRPFRGVEQPEMYGCLIGYLPHLTAQGIDFLDQLPLGETSDGGITRHEGHRIQIDIEHERGAAHPGRR